MGFHMRLLLGLMVLFGLVTLVGLAHPEGLSRLGLDWWQLPGAVSELEGSQRYGRNLDEVRAELHRRMEMKNRIVRNVVAGRLHGSEAIRELLDLSDLPPQCIGIDNLDISETTPQARMSCLLIKWVQEARPPLPNRQEVVERLERELAGMRTKS